MSDKKEKLIRRLEKERDDAAARAEELAQVNDELREQIKVDEDIYKKEALKDQDAHIKALTERNEARNKLKEVTHAFHMQRRLTYAAILASIGILATSIVCRPEPEIVYVEVDPPTVIESVDLLPEPDTRVYYDVPLDHDTQNLLRDACHDACIPMELALAVIQKETGFQNIVGDDGYSQGYMQIQKKWHAARMERLGVTDLMDPESNFRVGCDFLGELLETYPLANALAYYNSGNSKLPNAYAETVMDYFYMIDVEDTIYG